MKPFPLQLEGVKDTMAPSATDREYRRSMALDALEQDPARARKSLELDLAMQRPTYADLLSGDK